MKQLILVLFVTMQMLVSTPALAWSPLEAFETAIESERHCYITIAENEADQDSEDGEEEEEEPDCD